MRKTMFTSLSLFWGLTLITTAAMAWGPGLCRSSGTGQEFVCLDLPILGEKQFHKVEALQNIFLEEIESLQHDLVTKRTELRILRLSADSDPDVVKAKQEEILNLRLKLQEKALNLRLGIWKVLKPEQQAQFSLYGRGMGKTCRMGRW